MESTNSSNSSKGGVILEPPFTEKKKQISPSKRWCFTLNNYTKEECSSIVPVLSHMCDAYIVGKEVGESGTPHLQGYLEFKVKRRPLGVFTFTNRIKWLKAKGTGIENSEYCSKDGDLLCSHGFVKPITTIKKEEFYNWQKEMVEIFETPCKWNCRTIYWRYGDINIGKTQLSRWICHHMGGVVIGGANGHVLAQVQNQPAPIYIILLSYGDDKISYRAVEQIKDGLFSTAFGCDNNKMEIRDAPHLLIIGNEPPDTTDRHFHPTKWDVKKVYPDADRWGKNVILEEEEDVFIGQYQRAMMKAEESASSLP